MRKAPSVSAARGYAFLGTRIAVGGDLPSLALWLDEFFIPAFAPWTGDAPDVTVAVSCDHAAYQATARSRPAGDVRAAPCFALDQETVRHPAWTVSDRTVLADERAGVFYVLGGARVDVVAHPSSDRMRTRVMRVVRELATTRALASPGRFQLHAAALAHHGRALLLAGPKGAGKTTLLGSLAATGAAILTNDRALLCDDEPIGLAARAGFVVHGIPTIVSIRPGTLALLPRLARGVAAGERLVHLTLAEADAGHPRRGSAEPNATLALSPSQLARQLGTRLGAPAPLGAVAFPEPHADPDDLAVERLDPADAERRLFASRYGGHAGPIETTVFARPTDAQRPADSDRPHLVTIAVEIPCFAIQIGSRRLADTRAAEAVLAKVLS